MRGIFNHRKSLIVSPVGARSIQSFTRVCSRVSISLNENVVSQKTANKGNV